MLWALMEWREGKPREARTLFKRGANCCRKAGLQLDIHAPLFEAWQKLEATEGDESTVREVERALKEFEEHRRKYEDAREQEVGDGLSASLWSAAGLKAPAEDALRQDPKKPALRSVPAEWGDIDGAGTSKTAQQAEDAPQTSRDASATQKDDENETSRQGQHKQSPAPVSASPLLSLIHI